MFWVLKYSIVCRDVSELALSWWRMIRRRLFVFLISLKISGKQMVVYHSKLSALHCTNYTVATWPVFPKKQATICFEVFPARLLLDLVHLETPIQSTVVYFLAHTHRYMILHLLQNLIHVFLSTGIAFLEHLFAPIDSCIFLDFCQIIWDSTRTNIFYG